MAYDVPLWERYTLTIEEAAVYFRIGENKLRKIISDDKMQDLSFGTGIDHKSKEFSLKNILISATSYRIFCL